MKFVLYIYLVTLISVRYVVGRLVDRGPALRVRSPIVDVNAGGPYTLVNSRLGSWISGDLEDDHVLSEHSLEDYLKRRLYPRNGGQTVMPPAMGTDRPKDKEQTNSQGSRQGKKDLATRRRQQELNLKQLWKESCAFGEECVEVTKDGLAYGRKYFKSVKKDPWIGVLDSCGLAGGACGFASMIKENIHLTRAGYGFLAVNWAGHTAREALKEGKEQRKQEKRRASRKKPK